jgi:hypothetical protein
MPIILYNSKKNAAIKKLPWQNGTGNSQRPTDQPPEKPTGWRHEKD